MWGILSLIKTEININLSLPIQGEVRLKGVSASFRTLKCHREIAVTFFISSARR